MPLMKRLGQLVLATALAGVVPAVAGGQTQPAAPQLPALIQSVKGPDLFQAYCAVCHGTDGRGGGPAASSLKARMSDLTLLERRNRGEFPTARVRQIILGDAVVAAHGSREMPIWAPVFHQVEGDMDWGNVRLENLVKYLESIQSGRDPKASPARRR
jgi:mono/diheme cytochrome c family protein